MKRIFLTLALVIFALLAVGCGAEADVASQNVSRDADQFKVLRRIVFVNGITDTYLLEIVGYCSIGNYDPDGEVTITCKTGQDEYKKHFLGLSDNVTYVVEQLEAAKVSGYHYKIYFRPETILPDIDLDIE